MDTRSAQPAFNAAGDSTEQHSNNVINATLAAILKQVNQVGSNVDDVSGKLGKVTERLQMLEAHSGLYGQSTAPRPSDNGTTTSELLLLRSRKSLT
ncbi:unnamed protein product [Tilletia controversa]|uniref:Uncharacterized protein n=1 Tax=Tilletia controversa TaxID=13291 RepID=A0A8X7MR34_9BASI|nr:hypothetical protein A4X06_0g5945 [Tilletia controversa]CAD6927721.1 unnamed protein product [Tilletia controversa]CAD6942151.1 unnamed protein product [Tilletia controversa]CAD6971086.1 unnamed protein product [Tilletia controversa]CAD6979738.1 unnamed protein product [Tilletia controversa]